MEENEPVRSLLHSLDLDGARSRDHLLPLVYDELKCVARRQMADQRAGHTLQTTALVHEAWIKMSGKPDASGVCAGPDGRFDRGRFMRLAATAMRCILIDHARGRGAQKRGDGRPNLEFDDRSYALESDGAFLLMLNESVERLLLIDERMGRLVELRCFGGLDHVDIAEALGISTRQSERIWRAARAWLRAEFEVA